jgi:hypothetical protein
MWFKRERHETCAVQVGSNLLENRHLECRGDALFNTGIWGKKHSMKSGQNWLTIVSLG